MTPQGATHLRRPEYLTAWLYEKGATIPEWVVNRYTDKRVPDYRLGFYATAVDGEFWRWITVEKFNELYVSVDA